MSLLNAGSGSLSWSIDSSYLSSNPWLSFSFVAGVVTSGSTTPSTSVLSVNPVGMAQGVYQALVPISAAGSAGDRQVVSVTLQVVAPDAAPAPETSPAGLLFVAKPGQGAPPRQSLMLSNQGAGTLGFTLEPFTDAGGNWLGISAASGAIGTTPTAVEVSVSAAGLPAGIYHGRIVATYSTGKAQVVEVVLVVAPTDGRTLLGSILCQPQGITLLATTVGSGADLAVSFPATLTARLVNSCGEPVNDATVLVNVEGIGIVLQPAGNGLYRGVWTPEQTAPITTLKFLLLHPAFGEFVRSVTVAVVPAPGDLSLPYITTDGVVEAAGFAALRPLAPGGIVSIFGSGFAAEEFFASQKPLERSLGGVSVQIGNVTAPLFYVGPSQINAQVPFTAIQGTHVAIVVNANGRISAPQDYLIGAVQPGIFQSEGSAAALDGRSRPITPGNPARIGDTLQLFATGLGLVDPAVATGAPSPSSSTVRDDVSVRIGGVEVPVVYQGLAPGFVGLYQVNV
ncbi:MAG: hypothetical protein HY316_05535, partial [Acidobacteria bacterium]|nr:hypothetical protein [Acidobacteriota bacterium]